MKHLNYLLWIFAAGIILCSCTIAKRHFGNGYHVEWNRKIKTGTDREENSKIESPENQVALKSINERDSIPVDKVAIHDQPIAVSDIESTEVPEIHPVKQPQVWSGMKIKKNWEIKESKCENDPEEVKKPILHPLTYAIWGLWGIALAFCIVLIAGNLYAILVMAICMFLAMILGIITIVNIRKHPEKYKLKAGSYIFSIFSIVIGGIATFIGALILAAWDSF